MVAQTAGFFEALFFNSLLLGFLHVVDLVFDFLQVWRSGHALNAQTASRFVNEVNCLVGQMTIGNVAVGQVCSCNQCLVGNGDTVVLFVLVANALQDFNGVCNLWLFNFYWLEAALESSIFFEVLTELISCRCTNGLQLATSKHRL